MSQFRADRGKWVAAGAVAAVVMLGFPLAFWPRTLRPGELAHEPGLYQSPEGGYRMRIIGPSGGFKTVRLEKRRRRFWVWYDYVPYYSRLIDEERESFHCFDEFDRLWAFEGAWNPAWGKTRTQPDGGTAAWAPDVTLVGAMYVNGRGPVGAGSVSVVSELGGWEGVPSEFLTQALARKGER